MMIGRLLHCIVFTLILLLASFITAAAGGEVGQHEYDPRQRMLSTWMVDDDGCHETVLSNPLSSDLTLVEGVIFSLQSNGASTPVSSLSLFLDEAVISPSVGFDVFSMNGDGENYIGTTLDGSGVWKRIHGGTIEDTQLDSDGATFLGSFGPLTINAGEMKSFYVRFTKSVIRVKNLGPNADGWDGSAINLNDNSMQLSIGRAVSAFYNTLTHASFVLQECAHLQFIFIVVRCRQFFGPLLLQISSTNFTLHRRSRVKFGLLQHALQILLQHFPLLQLLHQPSLGRLKS